MSKHRLLFLACMCTLIISGAFAQSSSARISADEAEKLVAAAIYPNKSNAALEKMHNTYEPDFIFFEAVDPNPNHNAHMGTFAVNAWTGNVWDTAGFCRQITSSKLLEMLKIFRIHSGLTSAEFNKLRTKKPACDAT